MTRFSHRKVLTALLLAAALLVEAAATDAGPASAQSTTVLRWDRVGHIANQPIAWLAVPADGLQSGVLYARGENPSDANTPWQSIEIQETRNGSQSPGTTYRSGDGGKNWSAVADAPGHVVLPAGGMPAFSLANDALYRSADMGSTWSPVLQLKVGQILFSPAFQQDGTAFALGSDQLYQTTDSGTTWSSVLQLKVDQILFSPTFQQDGTAFALGSDQLWATTDSGATWTNLDPGQGQIIVAAALSPDFDADHTLWAAAISNRPTYFNPNPTDNADSAGLLVSQDAGATWISLSDGLQTDEGPYHQVLGIGVSPNFGVDQTLYVTALGPLPPGSGVAFCGGCPQKPVGTFESNDAGASWKLVYQPNVSANTLDATLNLSPAFAVDHTLMSTISVGGGSPSSYRWSLAVSTDAGGSWQAPDRLPSSSVLFQYSLGDNQGLNGMGVANAGGTPVMVAYEQQDYLSIYANRGVFRSLDGGATWAMLAPPGDGMTKGLQADLAQRQAILTDRVLQATANGDLWAYGAFAPCAIQPALGFGQAWTQHPEWQEFSGCQVGPEQPVQVHTSHDSANNSDTYWTDTACVRVTVPEFDGQVHKLRAGKDCGGAGDRVLAGAMLPFAGGEYWLYVPTSTGQGLVITSQGGLTTVGP